ncbi:hypothetical protein H1C71_028033, partial [Ictidomys tridecemlineatus]
DTSLRLVTPSGRVLGCGCSRGGELPSAALAPPPSRRRRRFKCRIGAELEREATPRSLAATCSLREDPPRVAAAAPRLRQADGQREPGGTDTSALPANSPGGGAS